MGNTRTTSSESLSSFSCRANDVSKARKTKLSSEEHGKECRQQRQSENGPPQGIMLSFLRNDGPVMLSLLRGGGTLGKTDIHAFKHFLPPPVVIIHFLC